eukprot:gnl/MRDRNA2_/MRDRNA2_102381_c0_seq1.p1 gnl/MRDRNA2_/MRDRNA2_102381_c0~~gnl/MRDRNA2_/MRDRNA2_102381_c0_seq1.p1  ORF type:complete len:877 (+),score=177.29 gnl/MRDRNA2_/MRDRNA2_102381_c0_seq1:76-2631(+)
MPTNKKQADAAVKIQSAHRGKAARREVEQLKANRPSSSANRPPSSQSQRTHIIELGFSPQHPLFEVGGRSGSVITKLKQPDLKYHQGNNRTDLAIWEIDEASDVQIQVQTGWKIIACNGVVGDGPASMKEAEKAKKKGLWSVIAFEIPEMCARDLGYRRVRTSTEQFELKRKLGNKSLGQMGELSESEKKDYLRSASVLTSIVDSSAVFETEVLLGQKKGSSMERIREMFTAAKRGDAKFLEKTLQEWREQDPETLAKALLQRDGGGNVILHHAANQACAKLLAEAEPSALSIKNKAKQTPLHTYLGRVPEATESPWKDLQENISQYFCLDAKGLSAAMQTEGAAREKMKTLVAPWSDFMAALTKDVREMPSALQTLEDWWGVPWGDGLAFHLFGETQVWKKGQHTKLSRQRLGIFWQGMERAFEGCRLRYDGAEPGPVEKLTRMLLAASRGPNHTSLDPRGPYRQALLAATEQLEAKSAEVMATVCKMEQSAHPEDYAKLQAIGSYFPGKETVATDSIWQQLGLEPELRHDLQTPSWVSNHDLEGIFKDLSAIGALGEATKEDAAYDLLQLVYADVDDDAVVQLDKMELNITRWHAAWLRGIFQGHLNPVSQAIQSACFPSKQSPEPTGFSCGKLCEKLVDLLTNRTRVKEIDLQTDSDLPEKFCSRHEAKSFMRICAKLVDVLKKWGGRLKECSAETGKPELAKDFLMTSSNLVLDILGTTFIADSPAELVEVYERLTGIKKDGKQSGSAPEIMGVPGAFNGFASDVKAKGGYRDIKLWVEVQCGQPHWIPNYDVGFGVQQTLLVETQLLLRGLFEEKHWSHLAYELRRGSFDWGHMKNSLSNNNPNMV